MPETTLLGFDFGLKKTGVAVGNTVTQHACPLEIIRFKTQTGLFKRLSALIGEWSPNKLVVGLALTKQGAEQKISIQSRRFSQQLFHCFGRPVILVDETDSSIQAQEILGNHEAEDAVAAAIILQRYLDTYLC